MTLSLTQRAALTVLYGEPHRRYHTLKHILSCLRELAEIPETLVLPEMRRSIEVAIWFHDAVYDPQARPGANERASVDLYNYSERPSGIPTFLVENMILSTIDHAVPVEYKDYEEFSYFLDIDLSILGRDPDTYNLYQRQIQDEYAFVSPRTYRTERLKVLRNLYARPRIYLTDFFHTKYEEEARANLRMEALLLSGYEDFFTREE